ncbi:MAG TPA: hypothetical protein VMW69_11800 [Spirochaetia bacterium]|nr:hypothetical protein [Spirochaetia bacterium]
MAYENHLYAIMYPNHALVGSQLTPAQFARHYTSGSTRSFYGKVIFAEIDPSFRAPYFDIDSILAELVPHEDGRPKATKFISSYRVLEHLDYSAIGSLYLTSPEGHCIELHEAPYENTHKAGLIRLYAEIVPMRMLVLSNYDFYQYSKYITDPKNRKGAPKLFYTQIDFDIPDFVEEYKANPFIQPPVPTIHPSSLRDGYLELIQRADKHTKGLCLDSSLDKISYTLIRHGFMFASQEVDKYYPMPTSAEIEKMNFKFWRSM